MKRRGSARTGECRAIAVLVLVSACGAEPADRPVTADPIDSVAATDPAPSRQDSAPATGRVTPPDATPAGPDTAATRAGEEQGTPVSPEGAEALRRAARAYERLRSMRAEFTMELVNPVLRRTTTSRGTIVQRAPDRIALLFTEPEGDVIVGDGTYFWIYYPSVNADQVTRAPAAQAGSGGVDLRAQFLGDPLERFEWTREGSEAVNGRPADVLTLVPREAAGYRQLRVWIDEADGLARRFEIHEHNGSTRTFEFSSFEINPALADSLFVFEPPPGVRIVTPPRSN